MDVFDAFASHMGSQNFDGLCASCERRKVATRFQHSGAFGVEVASALVKSHAGRLANILDSKC